MRHCPDCTQSMRESNRIWTATCFIVALFGLGAGFVLGQLSVVV